MAVFYKLYKSNVIKEGDKRKNMWYARAAITDTVNTEDLATIMQRNCTVKRSDILAVLTELTEVMQDQLQSSKRVKLNGLGSFKLALRTLPSKDAKEFSVAKNVNGIKVLFSPETKIVPGSNRKQRKRVLLDGCRIQELPENMVDKTTVSETVETEETESSRSE